jgi:DNA-binding NarL/FixJ family response regulator
MRNHDIFTPIPTVVIDDTPVKRRGVCEFVEETPLLRLYGQADGTRSAMQLIERFSAEHREQQSQQLSPAHMLVLSDLHLGDDNGIELGRSLLEIAPNLRIVIYTQDPSWTLAAEVFRHEYARVRKDSSPTGSRRAGKQQGLHGYALFTNIDPTYLEHIATVVVRRHETFIDQEVLNYLLKRLHGQRLTPRQEECASLIASGLGNEDIALQMGFLNTLGKPNMGPLENLVSELYSFFAIEGPPSDPGRRVLLAHAYEAYTGSRRIP